MRTALYAVAATCATAAPASMSDAARLRSLGYRASEIAAIRPTVASVVARSGLPRPRSGMPPSWVDESYDPYEERTRPLENVARFLRGVAAVLSRHRTHGGDTARRRARGDAGAGRDDPASEFLAPRGDEHYAGEGFLFDGPCDPAMRHHRTPR